MIVTIETGQERFEIVVSFDLRILQYFLRSINLEVRIMSSGARIELSRMSEDLLADVLETISPEYWTHCRLMPLLDEDGPRDMSSY